jgi:hypothetical protein
MRGEVALLTRNVKIQGENKDQWGCQIITGDISEADESGNIQKRIGSLNLNSVEIYNCS